MVVVGAAVGVLGCASARRSATGGDWVAGVGRATEPFACWSGLVSWTLGNGCGVWIVCVIVDSEVGAVRGGVLVGSE